MGSGEGVEILVTGGTLDKIYDPIEEDLRFESGRSHVSTILEIGRAKDVTVRILMLIDSFDMTNAAREQIAEAIARSSFVRIIVTHGTSTMVETAQYLGELFPSRSHSLDRGATTVFYRALRRGF